MQKQTKAIRIQAERSQNREHSVPLYLTSSFTFEDAEQGRAIFADEMAGNIYSRYMNPNVDEFVEKMNMLENAEDGIAFSTGMAAIFASMAGLLKAGDHVVASNALFGSCIQILTKITAKWGIECTFVPGADINAWKAAIKPNTKFLFCESPSNPGLELIDLKELAALKEGRDLILAVDNCFATPLIHQPVKFGANLVVHSATKFMDGQGRVLGGIITGTKELIAPVRFFCRHTGPSMSPFNAWVLSKSLETLELRMERHCANAEKLAHALLEVEGIQQVKYPFLPSHPQYELAKKQMAAGGAMLTFCLDGTFDDVVNFTKALTIPSLTSNLGDARTTITNPATTTHARLSLEDKEKLGISPTLMRISVGLEHFEDLIKDFTQAAQKMVAAKK